MKIVSTLIADVFFGGYTVSGTFIIFYNCIFYNCFTCNLWFYVWYTQYQIHFLILLLVGTIMMVPASTVFQVYLFLFLNIILLNFKLFLSVVIIRIIRNVIVVGFILVSGTII